MSASKASEVASAVNTIIALGSEDQQALLEVIEDYFTHSDESQQPDADSDCDDDLERGDGVSVNSIEGKKINACTIMNTEGKIM